MLKKVGVSQQGGATVDPEQREHVINIVERPSQMRIGMMTSAPQTITNPVIDPSAFPQSQPAGVVSSARTAVRGRDDVNEELVERIDELYQRIQQQNQSQHHAATTTNV